MIMPFSTDKLPAPRDYDMQTVERCVDYTARHFDINQNVIKAIIKVEGGKLGTLSRNTNGSYDMGIMQINTIHLPAIKKKYPQITWKDVTYSPCVNIGIGGWLLSQRLKETNNFWIGVGNYHSKTPKYRNIYLKKVYSAYKFIVRNNGRIR